MTCLQRWLLLAIAGIVKGTTVAVDPQISTLETGHNEIMQHRTRHPPMERRDEELENELLTTFDGSNGSHGTMFDIKSTSSNNIRITGLAIHINIVSTSCSITIYGRKGSHVGHETNEDGWNVIFDAKQTCSGYQHKTEVKFEEEAMVSLPPGETYAFFVYSPEPKLRYSDGEELNAVVASDKHVEVMEGTGLGGLFEDIYQPRVWNGVLRYITEEEKNEITGVTSAFKPTCSSYLTTADFFSSGVAGDYGTMFNIKTIAPIQVVGFDITTTPSAKNAIVKYEIFTKRHSFEQFGQDDISAWHYVAAGEVKGLGPNRVSTILQGGFVPVSIPADTIQGFYFTLHTPELITHETQLTTSGVFAATDELAIYAGVSVSDLNLGSYRSRRVFSGTVKYLRTDGNKCGVIPTEPPTMAPSVGPTSPEELRPSSAPSPAELRPSSAPSPLVPAEPASLTLVSPKTDAPMAEPTIAPTVAPGPTIETTVPYTFLIDYPSNWPPEVVKNSVAKIVTKAVQYIMITKVPSTRLQVHNLRFDQLKSTFWLEDANSLVCIPQMPDNTCAKFGASLLFYHSPSLLSSDVTFTFLKYSKVIAGWINDDDDITVIDSDIVPLQTEAMFTLSGVRPREMEGAEISHFQETVKNFLNGVLHNSAETESVDILSVAIEKQVLGTTERAIRRLQETSSSIDIATTITGQYLPPPLISFPTLVMDTIDSNVGGLIGALSKGTRGPASYFENLEDINIRPTKSDDSTTTTPPNPSSITTPTPTPDQTNPNNETKPGIDIGGIVINPKKLLDPTNPLLYAFVISFLLLIMLCMVCLYWRQSRIINEMGDESGGNKIPRRPSMLTIPTADASGHYGSDLGLDFGMSDQDLNACVHASLLPNVTSVVEPNVTSVVEPNASSVAEQPTYDRSDNESIPRCSSMVELSAYGRSDEFQHERPARRSSFHGDEVPRHKTHARRSSTGMIPTAIPIYDSDSVVHDKESRSSRSRRRASNESERSRRSESRARRRASNESERSRRNESRARRRASNESDRGYYRESRSRRRASNERERRSRSQSRSRRRASNESERSYRSQSRSRRRASNENGDDYWDENRTHRSRSPGRRAPYCTN